ncbi:MAG: D-2-hydroxyacid dehydrogenase [Candidatus Bilamarchaeaceae archaeon]
MKILIAEDMENEVVEEIKKIGEVCYCPKDINNELKDADVLIVRSKTKVTRDFLSNANKLKTIIRAGVGLDNIDASACAEKGIKVFNTPGASSNAVAELVIGHIFSAFRFIAKAHCQMKNNIWDKKNLVGREIQGKTLGIIGYGRIGSLVAKKALALGMKVVAYNPEPRSDENVEFVSFEELLKSSDVISLHVPSTPETKKMINDKTIQIMKNGVVIINTARGDVIDEDALYNACKNGKVAAACLDVFPQEPYTGKLLQLDNVYCTPHLGASTKEAQMKIGVEIISILKNIRV